MLPQTSMARPWLGTGQRSTGITWWTGELAHVIRDERSQTCVNQWISCRESIHHTYYFEHHPNPWPLTLDLFFYQSLILLKRSLFWIAMRLESRPGILTNSCGFCGSTSPGSLLRYTINDRSLGRLLTSISSTYNTDLLLWKVESSCSHSFTHSFIHSFACSFTHSHHTKERNTS